MTETAAVYAAQKPPDRPWGCWSGTPRRAPHPWLPIADAACGFDERLTHPRCQGCHRSREESPRQQLDALNALGDVAKRQEDMLCRG